MAIAIKNIPTLNKKEAEAFIKKAETTYSNKASVDFTRQVQSANSILAKANLNK